MGGGWVEDGWRMGGEGSWGHEGAPSMAPPWHPHGTPWHVHAPHWYSLMGWVTHTGSQSSSWMVNTTLYRVRNDLGS